jgi:hypothetical protein
MSALRPEWVYCRRIKPEVRKDQNKLRKWGRKNLMRANVLAITQRRRESPLAVPAPSDFEFVTEATVDAAVVARNPAISLYCLDHVRGCALFVETPAAVDLTQAPFFYQAQYEHALRVFELSYATLHALATTLPLDDRRLVLVYSVGRAGSTFVSSAFNAVDGAVSLSEPDVFTQLVALRDFAGGNDAEIAALVRSSVKLLCKPTPQVAAPRAWVLKLRSFGIELGDLLHAEFPAARNLFLYRDLESWMQSAGRALAGDENDTQFRAQLQAWFSTLIPSIARHVQTGGPVLPMAALGTEVWLATMERYLALHERGVPLLALRFADLRAAPLAAMLKILAYCGLPLPDRATLERVLERDSQQGTPLSREVLGASEFRLTATHLQDSDRVLAAHPVIRARDFVVPSTWMSE